MSTTTTYTSSIPLMQSTSTSADPGTVGTAPTSLDNDGRTSAIPFNTTSLPTVTTTLDPETTSLVPATTTVVAPTASNIFVPVATDNVDALIGSRSDHPVPRTGINQTSPIETNKFYANFFLGNQDWATFTYPYSVNWARGSGSASSWGLSISHVEASQVVFGDGDPAPYYVNPIGIQYVVLSAEELGTSTVLSTDSLAEFSINVNLAETEGAEPKLTFPIVQGMGFVTAVYNGATPLLQSGVYFQTLQYDGSGSENSVFKYTLTLDDGTVWFIYVTPDGAGGAPPLSLVDSATISGPSGFFGIIQVAKQPASSSSSSKRQTVDASSVYDISAGVYAESANIYGAVDGNSGSYTLSWTKGGLDTRTLLMWALPHHVQSFDDTTANAATSLQLRTSTKGMATAVVADQITMVESNLPADIGLRPWSNSGNTDVDSATAIDAINNAAGLELAEDMDAQTNLDSMYFSGKVSRAVKMQAKTGS